MHSNAIRTDILAQIIKIYKNNRQCEAKRSTTRQRKTKSRKSLGFIFLPTAKIVVKKILPFEFNMDDSPTTKK
jgi:hypothetical protein